MKIKVELFGVCRELSDKDYIDLELNENSKIKDVRDQMIEIVKTKFPENNNYLEMVKKSAFSSKDEIVEEINANAVPVINLSSIKISL